MATTTIVCNACGAGVPNGRLACPECGELLASVAGTRWGNTTAAEAAVLTPEDLGSRCALAFCVGSPAPVIPTQPTHRGGLPAGSPALPSLPRARLTPRLESSRDA